MNQPNDDDHNKSIEERVVDLEQLFGSIIKNEEALIRLSERHRFNLQEIGARVGNIELDLGDVRERFDNIERTMATKEDISELKATMATKNDVSRLEKIMLQILDRLPQPEGE